MIHWNYLGLTPYLDGLATQEALKRRIADNLSEAWILLLEHPPVITGGKRSAPEDLLVDRAFLADAGIGYHDVHRGGQLTYHGPGQLVAYFLFHLKTFRLRVPDLVELITNSIAELLALYDIEANYDPAQPGLWVDGEKIASIGLGLNKGITSHGMALNVVNDLEPFTWIVPCGLPRTTYVNVARCSDRKVPSLVELAQHYVRCFERVAELGPIEQTETLPQ